jgi:hypothetical protein
VRSAQHFFTRAALLGAVLLAVGCFRPSINSGAFACGNGGTCPDNFFCDSTSHLCLANGSAGTSGSGGMKGTGGTTGTGGQGGKDAGMDMAVDHPCLPAATANCPTDAAVTGLCDPICNTGCQCFEKCSVNTANSLTCNPLGPPGSGTAGLLQGCEMESPPDKSMQTDNCAPGQICLAASACPVPRCYQFCRGSSDCQDGASCSRDGGAFTFCDVPPVACNPLPGANTGCGSAAIGCYLSPTSLTTLCDCQFARTDNKNGTLKDPCTHSRDCLSGYVCTDPTGFGKECFPVCLLPTADGGAPASGPGSCPGACMPLASGNTVYGFCNE